MSPLARRLYLPSIATAAFGTAISLYGVLHNLYNVSALGTLALVAAIPALSYCLTARATQASDDQLAETHRTGYRLALQHVAMGLLDPPAPPDGGERAVEDDTQKAPPTKSVILPDNVWPFRPREDDRRAV
ncbi:hypothetical protein [Streptomyces silvensis]|uniref:Uncharacterized protein n=1 Tax=Streptomyces silvensis TaxID=1765722 RepID=A0A0W7X9W3_9ACTN|nr:hypothetical protein [Streptomyces silvensis]KUF19563.1 hypothetical protein AT728_04095 [Streptomyces silvensis]